MILVDSSVWIDYLRGIETAPSRRLDDLMGERQISTADLILAEVLQGAVSDRDFNFILALMSELPILRVGGREVAIEAAANYRLLRARGITVRKTIDALIATYCILHSTPLLFQDRDFDPFVEHLGLVSAMA
jgi:hypothetical protein